MIMNKKQTTKIILFSALIISFIFLFTKLQAEEHKNSTEKELIPLGITKIGKHTVAIEIAYSYDSAILVAVVSGKNGNSRYIPLVASTYRGISSLRLDILSPDSNSEIWISTSWPEQETVAHYRFGSEKAITPFGEVELLKTPFPQHLSGAPKSFQKKDGNTLKVRASFYHYGTK